MKWLAWIGVVVVALAGAAWFALLDADAPKRADGVFDLAAFRALVADDAPETLPTGVRVEFVGESEAPSFAAEAGAFGGNRTFSYVSYQVASPSGDIVIDGAVDRATLDQMSDGKGTFSEGAYTRVLDAMTLASRVMITHEHLDHVMAVARHPLPETIAPHLLLTRQQLDGLPQHAPGGHLAPAIAAIHAADFTAPARVAPGVVAFAAPGHSPGTIVIYVRGAEREYLFIGDIAWVMDSVRDARGRPRLVHWLMSGVDPDRPAVLRQLRALHEIAAADPDLVMLPAHDSAYLRGLVEQGVISEGFIAPATN